VQRKPTKNTRGPNADEKRFQAWLKEQPCSTSGHSGPSIVHHCEGATFKHNKTLVGHWFCLPLCPECDDVITQGSRRAFRERFGSQSSFWIVTADRYMEETGSIIPDDVISAIEDWNK